MISGSLSGLRRLAAEREPDERCELCGAGIPADHRHLLELRTRMLTCSCRACSLLFEGRTDARYRPIPTRVLSLPDLRLDDAMWDAMLVPVNLAFFVRAGDGRVTALYPSPAGATESRLSLDAWRDLEVANPVLRDLEPDVEALLVNRMGHARDHFVVPIDECYRLVGTVRSGWRGLSGGTEVWREVAGFFTDLRGRARTVADA